MGGGGPRTEATMKKFPFFFVQNSVSGVIKGVYTSKKDAKPSANMKRSMEFFFHCTIPMNIK